MTGMAGPAVGMAGRGGARGGHGWSRRGMAGLVRRGWEGAEGGPR